MISRHVILMMGFLLAIQADSSQTKTAKIVPLLAGANAAAQKWQADSDLIGVFATLDFKGELDLRKLAAPPNFEGGMLAFAYRSSLAGQERTFTIDSNGNWTPGTPLPLNPSQEKASLGSGFMDLDEALLQAKAQGLLIPAAGTPGHLDVRLTAVRIDGDGTKRTWQFASLDMSQPFVPNMISQTFVSADSGKAMTRDEAEGVADLNARMEALVRGRALAKGQSNFASWRLAAGELMRDYRPDMMLYEISLAVDYSNQRMTPKRAIFRYFGLSDRPVLDGEWQTAQVTVDGSFVSLSEAANARQPDRFFPRPVPINFIPPDEALTKFWTMELGMAPNQIQLLLHHSGLTPAEIMRPAEPGSDGPPDDPKRMPVDRWLWRTAAWRSQDASAGPFRGQRPVQTYLFLEASPALTQTAGTSKQETPLLDRGIVGSWSVIPAKEGDASIALNILSDGAYAWVTIGAERAPHRGKFHAFNGRWTLVAGNTNWEDAGSYRFPTDDSLELVGRNDKYLFSLEAGSGVVATRKSVTEPQLDLTLNQEMNTSASTNEKGSQRTTTRNEDGFAIEETFLATSSSTDLTTFGDEPWGMAVCSGGDADDFGLSMSSQAGLVRVQFNGVFGPNFQVIDEVVVSPDGRHHGYFAMNQDRWSIVIDGQPLPVGPQSNADDVNLNSSEIVFSEDGKRWGTVSRFLFDRDGDVWDEQQVLVDGKPAAPTMTSVIMKNDEIEGDLLGICFSNPCFSPDGAHFAYIRTEPREVASKRTAQMPSGETTNRIRFAPGKACVVIDSEPQPEFEEVKKLKFTATNTPVYFGQSAKGWQIIQPQSQSGTMKSDPVEINISPEGLGIAVTKFDKKLFGTGGTEHVEFFSNAGNWKSQSFDEVTDVALGPQGKPTLVIGTLNDKYVVVIDGKKFGTYEYAGEAVVSGQNGRWAFVALNEKNCFAVIDGVAGPMGSNATKPVFSSNSTQCAYVLRDANGARLLVEGKERTSGRRIDGPVFSPDGTRLAYYDWSDPDGSPSVAVDGKQIPGFDRAVFSTLDTRESAPAKSLTFESDGSVRFIAQRGDDYFRVSCKSVK